MLAGLVGLLCVSWPLVIFSDREAPTVSARRVAIPLLGFGGLVFWAWLQTMPVWPVALADPIWLEAQRQLTGETIETVPLAMDRFAANIGIMKLLSYAGVMWLALQYGRSSWRARQMVETLALAGGAYALYGLIVFVAGNETILWMPKWAYPDSLTSTFVNRNSFATYAGLALLCALVTLMQRLAPPLRLRTVLVHFGRSTAFYGLAALLLVLALIASGSRAGTASALIALVVLVFMRKVAWQPVGPLRWRALGQAAAAAGLMMISATGLLLWSGALDGDFADRKRVYGLTWEMVVDRPLLGHGSGSFAASFATIRTPDLRQVWNEAHNTYLELAFDLGIPAVTLLLIVMIWLIARCIQGGVTRRRDAIYPLLGVVASLQVGFHALFDFSLQIPAVNVTWAMILGVAVAQSWSRGQTRQRAASAASVRQDVVSASLSGGDIHPARPVSP